MSNRAVYSPRKIQTPPHRSFLSFFRNMGMATSEYQHGGMGYSELWELECADTVINGKVTTFLVLLLACLSACAQDSPSMITRDIAIAHSFDLLVNSGRESRDPYDPNLDKNNFAFVRFPNGDLGVIVAWGFSGPARGYRFLYRVRNEQLDLVQLILKPANIQWGLSSLQDSKREQAQVEIEFLHLFRNQDKQIVKMTGASHDGTGLWEDGYFEILVVGENGLEPIFSGVEYSTNTTNYEIRNRYRYVDSDRDGNTEIVESRERCEHQLS